MRQVSCGKRRLKAYSTIIIWDAHGELKWLAEFTCSWLRSLIVKILFRTCCLLFASNRLYPRCKVAVYCENRHKRADKEWHERLCSALPSEQVGPGVYILPFIGIISIYKKLPFLAYFIKKNWVHFIKKTRIFCSKTTKFCPKLPFLTIKNSK